MKLSVKITKLQHAKDLSLPAYATSQSAGMDLLAAIFEPTVVKAGEIAIIPTGIAIALPEGFEAQIRPRSGLAAKFGITVLNTPGTIDADYRGEIKVILINHSSSDFVVERGMRIAQMVVARYEHIILEEVQSLEDTSRGAKGFGSTGH
ncbi:MAG: dUTP diphosphatase [Candidatus Megaira endosymbiont of Carteria cerasiformis]|jgi:dUTP pyrophosphatase|nr:dUTP diphosphatase [Candidatus Megaera polyxenophila]MCC8461475.1 dUTP diphosphatase [Candidatus Megaera polyxenophila]